MENKFYNENFDELLKNSTDQYRMFPSEKVWKGINNRLHTRRRWFGAGLAFLLLSIGTVTWVMLTNRPLYKNNTINIAAADYHIKQNKPTTTKESTIFIAPEMRNKNQAYSTAVNPLATIIARASIVTIDSTKNENVENSLNGTNAHIRNTTLIEGSHQPLLNTAPEEIKDGNLNVAIADQQQEVAAPKKITAKKLLNFQQGLASEVKTVMQNKLISEGTSKTTVDEVGNLPPSATKHTLPTQGLIATTEPTTEPANKEAPPYSIESVNNSYVKLARRKKAVWQIYFTPSVTYRSLKENQAFIKAARLAANPINQNSPSPAAVTYGLADLENVVTHKADLGFQLGASVSHALSRKLRWVSGFQFNVNKYDIKAYGHTTEVATISLNTLGRRSSVSTVTSYRVIGSGYNVNWLRNFYFSASVPMGLEYVVVKGKRSYLGVAANVQPTYVLDNKSYLVSTDYKNYAQVPSLTRHWNLNTGAEIFAGIINKKSEWRISPQVRYQALSSYKNTYPVKENLFDVGLKVGLILK
jgi:hypothetical protein